MRNRCWRLLLCLMIFGLLEAEETHAFVVLTTRIEWQSVESPLMPPSAFRRGVYRDPTTGSAVSQLKYPKGYVEPPHRHSNASLFVFVLKGCLRSEEGVARAGAFIHYAPGSTHRAIEAVEETELLVWTNGPVETTLFPEQVR